MTGLPHEVCGSSYPDRLPGKGQGRVRARGIIHIVNVSRAFWLSKMNSEECVFSRVLPLTPSVRKAVLM